jgi:hypothetical protein
MRCPTPPPVCTYVINHKSMKKKIETLEQFKIMNKNLGVCCLKLFKNDHFVEITFGVFF